MARNGTVSGGRPRGARNKDTLEAEALAQKLGIDPFEVLLRFAAGDWKGLGYKEEMRAVAHSEEGTVYDYTIPTPVRAKCAEKATEFLRPKLKSIEFTGDAANAAAFTLSQMMANAAALQESHAKANAGTASPDKGAAVPTKQS